MTDKLVHGQGASSRKIRPRPSEQIAQLEEQLERAQQEIAYLGSFPELNPAAIVEIDAQRADLLPEPGSRRAFPGLFRCPDHGRRCLPICLA